MIPHGATHFAPYIVLALFTAQNCATSCEGGLPESHVRYWRIGQRTL